MPSGFLNIKDKVVFPAVNAEDEAKLKRLLQSIGDFMGATLVPQFETIITVKVPADRADIYMVLYKIMNSLKNGLDEKPSKPAKEAAK